MLRQSTFGVIYSVLTLCNPHLRARGNAVEKGNQILRGYMNAAMGLRTAQSGFIAAPVDIDISVISVHFSPSVVAWLQAFQPEDAMDDGGVGQSLPSQANYLPTAKDRSRRLSAANFSRDSMKPEWRLIRVYLLAKAVG